MTGVGVLYRLCLTGAAALHELTGRPIVWLGAHSATHLGVLSPAGVFLDIDGPQLLASAAGDGRSGPIDAAAEARIRRWPHPQLEVARLFASRS